MSRGAHRLANAAGLAGLLLLQACGTLPIASKPVGCSVDDALLVQTCAAPRPVTDGITYGDVLAIARQDRKALLDCQTHLKTLQAMLTECRSTIKAYGSEIDRINAEMAAQRR